MAQAAPTDQSPLPAEPTAEQGDRWTPRLGWMIGFLTVISTFNYLDRSLLGLLLPLIKADLHLSDTALGLISGLAFAIFYSTLGIPIAGLADRYSRRNIIAIGFGFWSLMTALTAYVSSGIQMAFCRFLMGAGEAAGLAPSQSMIADSFSRARRPLALAILTTASAIDALIFLPLAAWAADLYGWRVAFEVAGLGGFLLAILFYFTVREPDRVSGPVTAANKVPLGEAIIVLWRSPAFRVIMIGVSFMGGALYATGTWTTALLTRVHGLSITEIGVIVTPLRGVIGIVGIMATGWLTDRLGRRDPRWRFRVPAIASIILAPAYVMMLLSDTPAIWIAGLGITAAFYASFQGPIFAATMALAPDRMKTVAVAINIFFTGLVGQVLGPLIVGALNDYLAPTYGEHAIRYSMLAVAVCSALGGLCFLWAGRLAQNESERAV
ncbi:spinster family MFS transporter [Sphingobium nicotianae]|uniref:MFS transporter n=1 Tax=Sphingobium nicotianae TaxID=2782607 RepID=A0A9X1DE41_9SPHN|nr:MFS transporter [Sphingobium nicotianae]MBT2188209.1 MFS transporter [Sphingobium nicotianae]